MRGRSYFSFPFLLLMTLNEFFIEVSLFFLKAKLMIFSFAFFWGGVVYILGQFGYLAGTLPHLGVLSFCDTFSL